MNENELYEIVINEIRDGIYNEELWQRVLSDNNENVDEAESEYIELRIIQLRREEENKLFSQTSENENQFSLSRKPANKRNIFIGITILFLLVVFIVLLGYLLHDYFN